MKIPVLRLPYSDEEISYIRDGITTVMKSGFLTMGDNVAEFERRFAEWVGAKHAVAVNSGTSALEISLRALNVAGGSVIIPDITFMATAIAVVHAGARVIFADVCRDDLSLDPADIERKIQPDTKGVILVHIGGIISSRLEEIRALCEEAGLFLIEDAAHAHGSTYGNRRAGTLATAAAFSFYPTKILTTAEGGMLTTDDEHIFEQALILREHGKADHSVNVHTEFGYNWRFSEIHALLGLEQMDKADYLVGERRRLAGLYDERLDGFRGLTPVAVADPVKSAYYKYIVYLDDNIDRRELKQRLHDEYEIVLPGEVYSDTLHDQPVFAKYPGTLGNKASDEFPEAKYVADRQICLPLYPGITDEEVAYVVDSLGRVIGG